MRTNADYHKKKKKRLISFKKSKKHNYSNALTTEINGAMNTNLKGKMYCNTHFLLKHLHDLFSKSFI